MSDPLTIPCHVCGRVMQRIEEFREDRAAFDLYQCQQASCGRKTSIVFEPEGGPTPDERSFVEREVARRGAFFPSDYTRGVGKLGPGGGGFGRFGR